MLLPLDSRPLALSGPSRAALLAAAAALAWLAAGSATVAAGVPAAAFADGPGLAAVAAFAVSMSVTPGPNNLMVTASAATFGLRRTLPHVLGISAGFPAMILAVGLGLGGLFASFPALHQVLKAAGAVYLLRLAWRIATAERAAADGEPDRPRRSRPLTFLQAALFQWVNPKAWVIAVGAVTTYTTVGGDPLAEIGLVAAIFLLLSFPCVGVWALFGAALGRVLKTRRALRAFNLAMAALLALSLVPLVL